MYLKIDITIPRNFMTGLPVSGLCWFLDSNFWMKKSMTTHNPHFLRWRNFLRILFAIRHTSVLDLGCARSIGLRKIWERFLVWVYNDRIVSLRQILGVLRILRNRKLYEKLRHALSNNTIMWCNHFLFSLETVRKKWVWLLNRILKETINITCLTFACFLSPAEYFTRGHIALNMKNLTYQPTTKSSDRSCRP